ncbi:unnamed protein product [Brassica oleracea var. botrytis]
MIFSLICLFLKTLMSFVKSIGQNFGQLFDSWKRRSEFSDERSRHCEYLLTIIFRS